MRVDALAKVLKDRGIRPNVIISSDLTRTKKSAELIGAVFGITDIQVDPRFNDNKIPLFAGLTHEEKETRYPGKDEFDPSLKGHESREAVLERVKIAFEEAVENHRRGTIFLVGSEDPWRLLAFAIAHKDFEVLPPMDELPHLGRGEAWKVEVERERMLVENEPISSSERVF